MSGIIERWPGNVATLSGGTRNKVGFDRLWQREMVIAEKGTCTFCENEFPELVESTTDLGDAGTWRVRRNRMTPFTYHCVVIPLECFDHNTLWELGGERRIFGALKTAQQVMRNSDGVYGNVPDDIFFFVHIGYSAGQRWGHEHWHLVEPPTTPTITPFDLHELAERKDLIVFKQLDFTVVAGGSRAGQCYIIPDGWDATEHASHKQLTCLAHVILRLLLLFNLRFKSAQGLKPDFQVFIRFTGGCLVYAKYIPILNMWGASEYTAIDEMTPFVLPWPHQATVEHLLS